MQPVHVVAMLAIAQFLMFGVLVGRARAKHGVKAPAIAGSEPFERAFRVQMNTLEQLVCFLPALFVAALYWPPALVAAIGAVYLGGRLVYWRAYVADPSTRTVGFLLTVVPTFVLIALALLGALFR